ncbi:MAG: hypothetical protein R3E66_01220 [bacterium]
MRPLTFMGGSLPAELFYGDKDWQAKTLQALKDTAAFRDQVVDSRTMQASRQTWRVAGIGG